MAYHVRDLDDARSFYGDLLGCEEGRSTETWVDFDFFGHQISLHLGKPFPVTNTGRVGDHMVPMPHLGLVLDMPDWRACRSSDRVRPGFRDRADAAF
jgi:extradiol dioxygenase family protein